MKPNPHTERDKRTGRFKHTWGVIGHAYGRELAECQACGKVIAYGGGESGLPDKSYRDREVARRAGEPLFEGY